MKKHSAKHDVDASLELISGLDTSTFHNNYEANELVNELTELQQKENDERTQRLQMLGSNGITEFSNRVIINANDPKREDWISDDYLVRIGNSFTLSHKIEEFAVLALRHCGLDAKALPAIANGDMSAPKADIIVSLPCSDALAEMGCRPKTDADGNKVMQVGIEIKQAKGANALLGMPIDESELYAVSGFESYPKFLWCDSVRSYNEKQAWHSHHGVPLLGIVVAAPIAELSDEEFATLGLLWLPSPTYFDTEAWKKQSCVNPIKASAYLAYKATRKQGHIHPLSTLVDFLSSSSL